jgi:DNA-binding beta-propeller fold protein YncE
MKKAIVFALMACALRAGGYLSEPLSAPLQSQAGTPKFEIDPFWPKPLPEGWIIGRTGSVCADGHDHLVVTNRRDITAEEAETSKQAPSILIFDLEGNLVDSWGDSDTVPGTIHGCFVDRENNVWVTGNGDGIIQKWTHEGKLLMQIGKRGTFDSSDGTSKGTSRNSSPTQFFNPAGLVVDPANGDVYVADGYGNRRVAVFDRQGKFLRQWGRQATKEEIDGGVGGAFAQVVHCIAMGNDGLLYVCDRQGDRVQVFDKIGNFKRNIWVRTGTPTLPDPRGTVWWIGFSRDPEQRFMYVMNGRNEQLHVLDRASGKILSSFGRPGHMLGNFTHGHAVAVDSKGSLYIAETDTGRRIQKFKLVSGR